MNIIKEKQLNDDIIIAESAIHGYQVMARKGTKKYVFYPQTNEWDHFDLEKDPHELTNIPVTGNNVPADILDRIKSSISKAEKFKSNYYSFANKLRPMFT